MSERESHLREGTLRAWLDGELGWVRRIRVRFHLGRCVICRARLRHVRAEGQRVSALLDAAELEVDWKEAWARVLVRSGAGAARSGRGPLPARWIAVGAAVAFAAVAYVAVSEKRAPAPGPGPTVQPGRVAGQGLLEWVGRWQRAGTAVARDVCCVDLDGGGLPDDGLFTLNGPDERVAMVIVYEDPDGSGVLTARSLVRYMGSAPRR